MDLRKELLKFMDWANKEETNIWQENEKLIDDYMSFNNSMSDCERQPVTDNKQTQLVCPECGEIWVFSTKETNPMLMCKNLHTWWANKADASSR